MIKRNLKLAFRVFTKNKYYFLLNLANLTIGIVCGIIILLYLQNYINFDKHHVNHTRIYRVGYEFNTSTGRTMKEAKSSERIGPMFKDEYPEVNSYVRFRPLDKVTVSYNNNSFVENDILSADTSIFNIFTHEFIAGEAKYCFEKKNSIVLVNNLAKKYFGDTNPIGKTILIDSANYEVTGVLCDLPDNVHLKFSALVRFESIGTQWFTPSCYTYLLLNKKAEINGIYQKYPQLYEKYMSEQAQRVKATIDIVLEPLAKIHFNSELPRDFPRGNKVYIYIFGIVGLFIVIIASVNYINLSTAFSINRTKEIGIKKIFGAGKKTLRIYFVFESIFITLIAYLISVLIVSLIIDSDILQQIFSAKLQFNIFNNFLTFLISFVLAFIIGLFSGLYPAFHLSSIPTLGATSLSFEHNKRSTFLRRVLIIVQFVLSIGVLIGILAMNKQMNYINNKGLGYNKENLITIPVDNLSNSELSVLKEKINNNSNIISTSTAFILPNSHKLMCNFKIESESGYEEQLFNWLAVDYDYIKTMEMNIVEGRDFSKKITSDANSAYIVNESFLNHFGWEKAVDKRIRIINGGPFKNYPEGKIIGVVNDFNIYSLHETIEPMIIVLFSGGYLHIRISENNTENTLQSIKSAWNSIVPNTEFNYSFLNEHLLNSYETEKKQFSMVKIFSVICFILSCLGLIGLSAFTIARRTKEVAIRKQLGASIPQIILVLYKEIALLILIALLISIPISNWVVNLWLDSFAYRIEIGILTFIISGLIAFIIGFLSVFYHSLKAAHINPVEALKYE